MPYPKSVLDIINECAVKYKEDAAKATKVAIRRIQQLPEYPAFVDGLVTSAVGDIVHQVRYESNRQMRNDLGWYSDKSARKVKTESSTSVIKVAESVYNYRISGTILGLIQGSEIPSLASNEERSGKTHIANAALLRKLQTLVPEDKRVNECVSERKLRKIMKDAGCDPTE